MKHPLTLIKRQDNRAGNLWHVIIDPQCAAGAALLLPEANNVRRKVAVVWDTDKPASFTVADKPDSAIQARDVCAACSKTLLEKKEGTHA